MPCLVRPPCPLMLLLHTSSPQCTSLQTRDERGVSPVVVLDRCCQSFHMSSIGRDQQWREHCDDRVPLSPEIAGNHHHCDKIGLDEVVSTSFLGAAGPEAP